MINAEDIKDQGVHKDNVLGQKLNADELNEPGSLHAKANDS